MVSITVYDFMDKEAVRADAERRASEVGAAIDSVASFSGYARVVLTSESRDGAYVSPHVHGREYTLMIYQDMVMVVCGDVRATYTLTRSVVLGYPEDPENASAERLEVQSYFTLIAEKIPYPDHTDRVFVYRGGAGG